MNRILVALEPTQSIIYKFLDFEQDLGITEIDFSNLSDIDKRRKLIFWMEQNHLSRYILKTFHYQGELPSEEESEKIFQDILAEREFRRNIKSVKVFNPRYIPFELSDEIDNVIYKFYEKNPDKVEDLLKLSEKKLG